MQPRASTFHHLSFIIKMTKTYWLGNIKGNRMGCRILLIVVKSREISNKGRGEVPKGKFLRLLRKNKVFKRLFPSVSLWGKTYSTSGTFSHYWRRSSRRQEAIKETEGHQGDRRSSRRHAHHLTHELDPGYREVLHPLPALGMPVLVAFSTLPEVVRPSGLGV